MKGKPFQTKQGRAAAIESDWQRLGQTPEFKAELERLAAVAPPEHAEKLLASRAEVA